MQLIELSFFANNKYLAVGEVSMGGKRLENVCMPLENFQATNKFYVDTLVEAATASDKALRKIQDGIFASDGEIDMNGNSITGLPNPVDKDAAANKNYVDNGGAIVKNPDGSFTAVSDIDFIDYRLKNLSNPKDDRDAVYKIYVDKKLSLPSLIGPKPIITVWAEEKGPLGDGHYEFSFGNGSSGVEHAYGGYCMTAPGRIIRGSLTATQNRKIFAEEVKVNITVNGKEQAQESIVKKSGDLCSCIIFNNPIELKQCDVINFISRTANSKITNAYVAILIELDLQIKYFSSVNGEKYFYSIILKIVLSVLQTGHLVNLFISMHFSQTHIWLQLQNKTLFLFSKQITHSSVLYVLISLMVIVPSSSSKSLG